MLHPGDILHFSTFQMILIHWNESHSTLVNISQTLFFANIVYLPLIEDLWPRFEQKFNQNLPQLFTGRISRKKRLLPKERENIPKEKILSVKYPLRKREHH